jgi:CxxC-x17-CxxC domain-containing protein
VCSECGQDTTVPFKPRGDRPVYCSDCFNKQRSF